MLLKMLSEMLSGAKGMLDALGDSPTLEGLTQTVQQINAYHQALDQLGKNLVGFSGYTDAAVSAW